MRIGRAQGRTDTGRRRLQNEDAFVCEPPLFAVADGMGGARAGELASGLAATAIEERVGALDGEAAVAELIREANARIFAHASHDPATAGMGTTVTVVLVDEAAGRAFVGHVGDSRAYRIAGGALEQLTADHSLVAELVRTGRLTEEEAAVHPHRSVITRALGTEADVEVDTHEVTLAPGELVLLCSDGLTTMVGDQEILRLATEAELDPHRVVDVLVDAANQAGGEDNITVVAMELVEGDPPERPVRPAVPMRAVPPVQAVDETATAEDVRRHGAGKGGRLPALLLVAAVLLFAALLLWWGVAR
jgi:protein phosphatase